MLGSFDFSVCWILELLCPLQFWEFIISDILIRIRNLHLLFVLRQLHVIVGLLLILIRGKNLIKRVCTVDVPTDQDL